jgi:hypothetical protein
MTSYKNTAIGNQPNRAAAVRAAIFVWTQLYLERLWLYFRERLDEAWRRKIVGILQLRRYSLRSFPASLRTTDDNIFYQSEAQLPRSLLLQWRTKYDTMQ